MADRREGVLDDVILEAREHLHERLVGLHVRRRIAFLVDAQEHGEERQREQQQRHERERQERDRDQMHLVLRALGERRPLRGLERPRERRILRDSIGNGAADLGGREPVPAPSGVVEHVLDRVAERGLLVDLAHRSPGRVHVSRRLAHAVAPQVVEPRASAGSPAG